MQPAIFLDRDGVINENRADHVMAWDEFVPVRGALGGRRSLAALGPPSVVVTNRAIIGRGLTQLLPWQARSYSGYSIASGLSHAARFIAHDQARRGGRPSLVSTMRLAFNSVQSV